MIKLINKMPAGTSLFERINAHSCNSLSGHLITRRFESNDGSKQIIQAVKPDGSFNTLVKKGKELIKEIIKTEDGSISTWNLEKNEGKVFKIEKLDNYYFTKDTFMRTETGSLKQNGISEKYRKRISGPIESIKF